MPEDKARQERRRKALLVAKRERGAKTQLGEKRARAALAQKRERGAQAQLQQKRARGALAQKRERGRVAQLKAKRERGKLALEKKRKIPTSDGYMLEDRKPTKPIRYAVMPQGAKPGETQTEAEERIRKERFKPRPVMSPSLKPKEPIVTAPGEPAEKVREQTMRDKAREQVRRDESRRRVEQPRPITTQPVKPQPGTKPGVRPPLKPPTEKEKLYGGGGQMGKMPLHVRPPGEAFKKRPGVQPRPGVQKPGVGIKPHFRKIPTSDGFMLEKRKGLAGIHKTQ